MASAAPSVLFAGVWALPLEGKLLAAPSGVPGVAADDAGAAVEVGAGVEDEDDGAEDEDDGAEDEDDGVEEVGDEEAGAAGGAAGASALLQAASARPNIREAARAGRRRFVHCFVAVRVFMSFLWKGQLGLGVSRAVRPRVSII